MKYVAIRDQVRVLNGEEIVNFLGIYKLATVVVSGLSDKLPVTLQWFRRHGMDSGRRVRLLHALFYHSR